MAENGNVSTSLNTLETQVTYPENWEFVDDMVNDFSCVSGRLVKLLLRRVDCLTIAKNQWLKYAGILLIEFIVLRHRAVHDI